MKKRKIPTGIVHISDSAAIVKFRNADLDLVRCGALLIGSMTGKHIVKDDNNFNTKSILSLYSRIARVEEFPAGRSVSYDITYVSDHPIKVATIPVGYGDGIPSQLSGNMEVLISGKRCKQIGAVNMDMLMVDASGVSCKEGDEVVLLGIQGDDEITLDDWSAWGGKSSTFFLSMLRDRIPHFYLKDGQVIK
jgi:alanine racemase